MSVLKSSAVLSPVLSSTAKPAQAPQFGATASGWAQTAIIRK